MSKRAWLMLCGEKRISYHVAITCLDRSRNFCSGRAVFLLWLCRNVKLDYCHFQDHCQTDYPLSFYPRTYRRQWRRIHELLEPQTKYLHLLHFKVIHLGSQGQGQVPFVVRWPVISKMHSTSAHIFSHLNTYGLKLSSLWEKGSVFILHPPGWAR